MVFDRGVPDCVAYAALMGTDPAPSILASEVYRYHREALVFEPLEEIYAVDDERTMSFADTVAFQGRSGIRTNEPDIPSSRWLETRSKTERLSFEISSSIARANGEDVRGCVSSMSHIRRIFYTRFMGKRHASGENVLESWRFFVPLGTLLAARSSTTTRGGPGPS